MMPAKRTSYLGFAIPFHVARSAGFTPLSFAVVRLDPATERPARDPRGELARVARGEQRF